MAGGLPVTIKLPAGIERDLRTLLESGVDLSHVPEAIATRTKPISSVSDLRKCLDEILGGVCSVETANVLLYLGSVARAGTAPSSVVANVGESLDRVQSEKEETPLAAQWTANAPSILQILQLAPFTQLVKIMDLSYDYKNIFGSARIITDIRPIFDDDRTRITAALVSLSLRINYMAGSRRDSLICTMDTKDLLDLKASCEDALVKVKIAEQTLNEIKGVVTVTPGAAENV